MAKAQKRSNREVRKPKATKVKPVIPTSLTAGLLVDVPRRKPKGKL